MFFSGHGDGDSELVSALPPELPERWSVRSSIGGGEGVSIGAISTRPATSETRCCDDRRRGRGEDGKDEERAGRLGVCDLEEGELDGDGK